MLESMEILLGCSPGTAPGAPTANRHHNHRFMSLESGNFGENICL
jgi:hypothetical protein